MFLKDSIRNTEIIQIIQIRTENADTDNKDI